MFRDRCSVTLCAILDELKPRGDRQSLHLRVSFVKNRACHDRGYAIEARELAWKPMETFDSGIRKTVRWYLDH